MSRMPVPLWQQQKSSGRDKPVQAWTPDPARYHHPFEDQTYRMGNGPAGTGPGVMIPRASRDGASRGFDLHTAGVVNVVDVDNPANSVTVDLHKLALGGASSKKTIRDAVARVGGPKAVGGGKEEPEMQDAAHMAYRILARSAPGNPLDSIVAMEAENPRPRRDVHRRESVISNPMAEGQYVTPRATVDGHQRQAAPVDDYAEDEAVAVEAPPEEAPQEQYQEPEYIEETPMAQQPEMDEPAPAPRRTAPPRTQAPAPRRAPPPPRPVQQSRQPARQPVAERPLARRRDFEVAPPQMPYIPPDAQIEEVVEGEPVEELDQQFADMGFEKDADGEPIEPEDTEYPFTPPGVDTRYAQSRQTRRVQVADPPRYVAPRRRDAVGRAVAAPVEPLPPTADEVLEKLGISFLHDKPKRPDKIVAVTIPGAGTQQVRFHDVIQGEGILVLVYDTRYEDGVQWLPPVPSLENNGESLPIQFIVLLRDSNKRVEVASTGIQFSNGCFDYIVLHAGDTTDLK